MTSAHWSTKLGLPHFAHLRAVANGLPVVGSAQRYLFSDSRHHALATHHRLVAHVRGLAHSAGYRDWRLLGISFEKATLESDVPNAEAWAARMGYDDMRWDEVMELYAQAYPADRKKTRNARMLARQLALIKQLEKDKVSRPRFTDALDDWLDPTLVIKLRQCGDVSLGDVLNRIARGGRWWRVLRGVGALKAKRLVEYMDGLQIDLRGMAEPERFDAKLPVSVESQGRRVAPLDYAALSGQTGSNRAEQGMTLTDANRDDEIIDAWIAARMVSPATERTYRKEARRLYLWAVFERGKALSSLNADDCAAYVTFLNAIPEKWIGRKLPLSRNGEWYPFARQLSAASRRQAHTILRMFYDWMRRAGYLQSNPWELVGLKVADDSNDRDALRYTRAFEPDVWDAINGYFAKAIDKEGYSVAKGLGTSHSPLPAPLNKADIALHATIRAHFVLQFVEAVGLRASELLHAKLSDFEPQGKAWLLVVMGKGGKSRLVAVPPQAVTALDHYLQARNQPCLADAISDEQKRALPLVSQIANPAQPIGYQALQASVRTALKKAVQQSGLPDRSRKVALKATLHWLRHTFGTRAIERGVSENVVMKQLGHADNRPTQRYTRAQVHRMVKELGGAFGNDGV